MLKGHLTDWCSYKCFYPVPQSKYKWIISAATLSDFTTAVKCTLLHNTCVHLSESVHTCVCLHEYIFRIVACSPGPWPFNLYSSEQSLLSTLQSGHDSSYYCIHNTLLAPSGANRYCVQLKHGRQQGRWRTVYKWHLPLIKSRTCRSTWSAEGLASTVTQAGPLILR